MTPLHRAAEKGHIEVVKALLDAGADMNLRSDDGGTPLHHAAREFHGKTAVSLLVAAAIERTKNRLNLIGNPQTIPKKLVSTVSGFIFIVCVCVLFLIPFAWHFNNKIRAHDPKKSILDLPELLIEMMNHLYRDSVFWYEKFISIF